ncbi:hypothetical protein ACFY5C_26975 [Streptomyces sp. NPDC012935]|uniref:hypothetical protein n=1 Tax=Streptomyces sp. NPDC012935 TaxID=3364857 RepID=UPI0036A2FF92
MTSQATEQVGEGDAALFPTTALALKQRNDMLRNLSAMPAAAGPPTHWALTLPEFMPVR